MKKTFSNFKWKQFEPHINLWAVHWYTRYPISYQNLQKIIKERRLNINHTTPYRWVHE